MENDVRIPGCDKIRQLIIGGTAVAKYIPDREVGDMDVMISDHDRGKVEEVLKKCLPKLTDGNRWRNVRREELDVFIESPGKFDETYARGHPSIRMLWSHDLEPERSQACDHTSVR